MPIASIGISARLPSGCPTSTGNVELGESEARVEPGAVGMQVGPALRPELGRAGDRGLHDLAREALAAARAGDDHAAETDDVELFALDFHRRDDQARAGDHAPVVADHQAALVVSHALPRWTLSNGFSSPSWSSRSSASVRSPSSSSEFEHGHE